VTNRVTTSHHVSSVGYNYPFHLSSLFQPEREEVH
jgi:hypothetical protein